VIVVSRNDRVEARSFTLLHEFAHLLKKKTGVCNLGGETDESQAPDTEIWCNGFAGSFLVPKASLLNNLRPWPKSESTPPEEIHRLSTRYRVSETVILRRLLHLGLISTTEYRESSEVRQASSSRGAPPSQREVKRNVPLERFSEFGAPFLGMVLRGASDGRLALTDLAEILDVRLKHLPAISDRLSRKSIGT
jgi:Zn-dependent peptidase ImmA (M78 family)